MQFPSCQHRFQQLSCIHCTVRLTGADDRVQLIDKQNDLSIRILDIVKNGFQTLLELATILCTGNQCAHIECKKLLIFESLRDITLDDSLRKAFDNGRLTNTGFTDQYRVILGLTGKNSNHITDLLISSDDRIQLLLSCPFHHIVSVFLKCIISSFRIIGCHSLIASNG